MKVLIALLLVIALGCEPSAPLPKWKVDLVRPDGTVQKSFYIRSAMRPAVASHLSGHTKLHGRNSMGVTRTDIIAPVGWFFDISNKATK